MSADNQQERLPKKSKYLHYYIAGFVDGEGCFSVSIHRRESARFGWIVDPMFQVYQHKDNRQTLELIKNTFQCGYITEKSGSSNVSTYIVDNRRDLIGKIDPFFRKHQLISNKYSSFLLFSEIVARMAKRDHWEKDGLKEIIVLAFRMNSSGRQRKYSLEEVLSSLEESSETTRQTILR